MTTGEKFIKAARDVAAAEARRRALVPCPDCGEPQAREDHPLGCKAAASKVACQNPDCPVGCPESHCFALVDGVWIGPDGEAVQEPSDIVAERHYSKMTTAEKFINAARDMCAAEARITEIRAERKLAATMVNFHDLAAMRKTRQRARRRMMYHWRKMMGVEARMAENAEWNAKARAEFA